jgi:small subunit ribosomal protein S5
MAFANNNQNQREVSEFEERVVKVARVSKKTKGGNQFGFSILVVVGDKKGRVGVGLGKGKDVVTSIKKGVKKAKKNLITVPLDGTTIPFAVRVKRGAGRVLLKPAPKGSGVIAGGPVRSVVEVAGIRDLSAKILGSNNQASNVYATFEALKQIQSLVAVKGVKLRSIVDIEREEQEKLAAENEKAAKKVKVDKPEAAKKPVVVKKEVKKVVTKKTEEKKVEVKTEEKAVKATPKKAPAKKVVAKK